MSVVIPDSFSDVLQQPEVESRLFEDDGTFPNNPELPAVLYRGAFRHRGDLATQVEQVFRATQWVGSWQNGIFSYHHYHSTAHEVLGVARGQVRVRLGGPEGADFDASRGDVLILPAGVSHKNLGATTDFLVVGAYPDRSPTWDLLRGRPGEREEALENIKHVPLPQADPVYGQGGPLSDLWGFP